MSFFVEENKIKMKGIIDNFLKKTTLQVRIPSIKQKHTSLFRKRAFPFAAPIKAGLTVEAAFCLTLMVFAMTVLMTPMKIMDTRRQLAAKLETINEELCRYAYIKQMIEHNKLSDVGDDAASMANLVADRYAKAKVLSLADSDGIQGASADRSSVLGDGETIDLILDYEIRMPFPILLLNSIPQSIRSCRRAWIGRTCKSSPGEYGGGETDITVYLGHKSTRYHSRRDCHYLSKNLRSVSMDEVRNLRSSSRRRYTPCRVCGAGNVSTVYVMPNGIRYHTQTQCSALLAYVRSAKLSEVMNLGGCSYCVE